MKIRTTERHSCCLAHPILVNLLCYRVISYLIHLTCCYLVRDISFFQALGPPVISCIDHVIRNQQHRCLFVKRTTTIVLLEDNFGLRVFSVPESVCVVGRTDCVNRELVHVITCVPFKLGSPNWGQRRNIHLLTTLLFCGRLSLTFNVNFHLNVKFYPILGFMFVHEMTRDPFKLGSRN